MREFNLSFNKVASAMLGHKPLVREVASEGRKTFISIGMATIEEIDEVVNVFRKANCPIELLHCVSTYPMKEEDANLRCIPMLKARYNCDLGYSGHESLLVKVCTTAVAFGATSLERHITLDRAMYGSDLAASVESHALMNFVETVRKVPALFGNCRKEITAAKEGVRKKLRVQLDG